MKNYKKIQSFTIYFINVVAKKRNSINLKEAMEILSLPQLDQKDIDQIAWRFIFYANQFKYGELKPATVNGGIPLEEYSRHLAEAWWDIINDEMKKEMEDYYSPYDSFRFF